MTEDELKIINESINAYKNTIRMIKNQIRDLEKKKGGNRVVLRLKLLALKYLA